MPATQNDPNNRLTLGIHLNRMVKRASGEISTSCHKSLERLGSAGNVKDLRGEVRVLEKAQPFGKCHRSVL